MLRASLLLFFLLANPVAGEGDVVQKGEEAPKGTARDETLEQLKITFITEVLDGNTIVTRDSSTSKKIVIKLGNTDLDESATEEAKEAARVALAALVDKQAVFWKHAPEDKQPPKEDSKKTKHESVVADIWTSEGLHVPLSLIGAGHVKQTQHYDNGWQRDVLSVESKKDKQKRYKELEEAMAEKNEYEKKAQEAAAQAAAEEAAALEEEEVVAKMTAPLSMSELIGFGVVIALLVGVATNFGQREKKKDRGLSKKK